MLQPKLQLRKSKHAHFCHMMKVNQSQPTFHFTMDNPTFGSHTGFPKYMTNSKKGKVTNLVDLYLLMLTDESLHNLFFMANLYNIYEH